jgi:fido (protein-threonine AMPylation protein)
MDWKSFTFSYQLNSEEVFAPLISIEAYKEAAINLYLPPDWRDQLDKLNRVRAVHGTTALEGNPLSEAEVSQQMDTLDQLSGRNHATKEQLQIRNSGLAQAWVRSRFYPGSSPMDLSDIHEMHRMITVDSDLKDNIPGKFRTHDVTVGSRETGGVHKGAPHGDVPKLMQDYIKFVNSRELTGGRHPVIRALLAHFYLVTIHPFGDGNGRVSRLIEAGILFQGGYNVYGFYGLSNYFYRNERDYKTMLQKSRDGQPFDVTPFIIFGLSGFAAELKGINNFIKTKLNRVVYRTTMVGAFSKHTGTRRRLLNQREYNLLHFLLTATEPTDPFSDIPSRKIKLSELRESPYVVGAYKGVTQRTFVRELMRLNQIGFIRFTGDTASKEMIVELNFEVIGRY